MSATSTDHALTEVNLSGIGDDLRAVPRWLHWRPRINATGKVDKIPTDPATGENIDSTKPKNHKHFDEAVAALRPGIGLGIVLNGDGLIGVDRDGCVGPDGALTEDAAASVSAFGSYAEYSPSGRGIRIIARGVLPPRDRKRDGNEIYDADRFLTITGGRVPGAPEAIAECQEAIDAFHATYIARPEPAPRPAADLPSTPLAMEDDEILRRARAAKNGPEFAALFDRGDVSLYENDHSAADLALCSMVAFWTQNPMQISRIFGQSALTRTKWERRGDYRESTIGKALHRSAFYTPPHIPETRVIPPNSQDGPSGADPCSSERDTIAALRAENAALTAENAALRADRDRLSRLQSATMTMFRSREFHAGEKVVGLVSHFEAEAAQSRKTTDPEGWLDTPLDRIAESAGCSAKVAGKHLTTIASTGAIETRTIDRRDPETGAIKKRRQIRVPVPTSDASPAPSLPERIIALSNATPERDPKKHRWGGLRVCPDCGDAGTVTSTTISCKGCGQVLSAMTTEREPESPMGHLALSTYCGSRESPMGQVVLSGNRARAAADLALREPAWMADAPAPWETLDTPPQPALFAPPDPSRRSHHFDIGD